eukprot:m.42735 g.42735  ORF g.42735 m.42735 type:complete len:535 (-) comp7073_c0_seq1:35-1639(-)
MFLLSSLRPSSFFVSLWFPSPLFQPLNWNLWLRSSYIGEERSGGSDDRDFNDDDNDVVVVVSDHSSSKWWFGRWWSWLLERAKEVVQSKDAKYQEVKSSPFNAISNLRIMLSCIIVAHHAGMPYGNAGPWFVEGDLTQQTQWLGGFFALSEAFVVPVFFILAGYFSELSLKKSSGISFLLARIKRLIIPLVTVQHIINPIWVFIISKHNDIIWSYEPFLKDFFSFYLYEWLGLSSNHPSLSNQSTPFHMNSSKTPLFSKVHMWFVETLFAVSITWLVLRPLVSFVGYLITNAGKKENSGKAGPQDSTCNNKTVQFREAKEPTVSLFSGLFGGVCIGLLTWLVRIWFPIDHSIGSTFLYWKPARYVQYVASFCLGIWLATQWGKKPSPVYDEQKEHRAVALLLGYTLFFLVARSMMEGNEIMIGKAKGGATFLSFFLSVMEAIVCWIGSLGLLSFYIRNNTTQSVLGARMGRLTYGVYLVHVPIVLAFQAALKESNIQGSLIWVVVTMLSIPSSFFTASLIHQIPIVNTAFGMGN